MKALVSKPVNLTQIQFNELCEKGGGVRGGPTRKKTLEVLRASGRALNREAYDQIGDNLRAFPEANPWHICYAVALNWGRFAKFDLVFTEAVIRTLDGWDEAEAKAASTFHYEKGPGAIRESLYGGWLTFSRLDLPDRLPDDLASLVRVQSRWLRVILNDKPRFMGGWNATAIFMVALFANKAMSDSMISPEILLPIGGPITRGLQRLHDGHLLTRPPDPREEDEALDYGQIMLVNGQLAELKQGLDDWSFVDIHSGIYMLGTALPESMGWYP